MIRLAGLRPTPPPGTRVPPDSRFLPTATQNLKKIFVNTLDFIKSIEYNLRNCNILFL